MFIYSFISIYCICVLHASQYTFAASTKIQLLLLYFFDVLHFSLRLILFLLSPYLLLYIDSLEVFI